MRESRLIRVELTCSECQIANADFIAATLPEAFTAAGAAGWTFEGERLDREICRRCSKALAWYRERGVIADRDEHGAPKPPALKREVDRSKPTRRELEILRGMIQMNWEPMAIQLDGIAQPLRRKGLVRFRVDEKLGAYVLELTDAGRAAVAEAAEQFAAKHKSKVE